MKDPTPPYSEEAERAILGCCLLDNRCLPVARLGVSSDHFFAWRFRAIFEAMIKIADAGGTLDHITLADAMKENGQLDRIGGPAGLDDLTMGVATTLRLDSYLRIVREKAAIRAMCSAAREVFVRGQEMPSDAEEFLAESRSKVLAAASSLYRPTGPSLVRDGLFEIYQEAIENKEPVGLVKTGIRDVDETTGGLWPGLLTVLAGRPSMGKSLFALNVAVNAALSGASVLYLTLEDIRKLVVLRLLSRFGSTDLQSLTLRQVPREKHRDLFDAAEKLSAIPLWLDDPSSVTAAHIQQLAASHASSHGLDLLVVDHLQEIDDEGAAFFEATTRSTRTIAATAKELEIPVLLLSQLNRRVEERPDKRPLLSDLKQSGEIEQKARAVWFLYRPAYYKLTDDEHYLELIVAKQTHGRTGTLRLFVDLPKMYVSSRADSGAADEYQSSSYPKDERGSKDSREKWWDR